MKNYNVIIEVISRKEISIKAKNRGEIFEILKDISLQTNLLDFKQEDIKSITSDIEEIKNVSKYNSYEEKINDNYEDENNECKAESESLENIQIACRKCGTCNDITDIIEDYMS